MTTIVLRELDQDNWRASLQLAVQPEQQPFIADHAPIALVILAKAYVRPGGLIWTPYAIHADDQPIGMLALAYAPQSRTNYWIYHFFIDARYQGRGYGSAALQAFVQMLQREYPHCEQLNLTVHPDNQCARALYEKRGFRPTGALRFDEPIYSLTIRREASI